MSSTRKNRMCQVTACENPVHAKGYCRKHYGQIWRKGEISSGAAWSDGESRTRAGDCERLCALERELKKAENMYRMVVGFEGRTRWRKEIAAVETEINRIQVATATSVAG